MFEENANVGNGLNELFHFACSVSNVGNGLSTLGTVLEKNISHFVVQNLASVEVSRLVKHNEYSYKTSC